MEPVAPLEAGEELVMLKPALPKDALLHDVTMTGTVPNELTGCAASARLPGSATDETGADDQ